ncbi:MAG: hypothetical protein GQ574_25025 [Crocinitomix sp.]|nr:hypothetical protein [Crocinitomix sp.]
MMTAKAHFFNYFALFVLFAGFMSACAPSNQAISYKTQFKGTSANGAHARALFVGDLYIIAAGQNGNMGVHILDTAFNRPHIQDSIPGIEDFRDVRLNADGNCLLMNSGENGMIYGISRGSFRRVLYDTAGVFFDGMAFWNDRNGIVFGDPINGKFFLAKTETAGALWEPITPNSMPNALENEAGFAASGTSIQAVGDSTVYFGTGMGASSRLFCSYDQGENWIVKNTPMRAGDSYGIYAMYFWTQNEGIIVGGSYKDSTYKKDICQYTNNGGDSWQVRTNGLLGYCSSIHGTANGEFIVATGRMGTFYTTNKGQTWDVLVDRAYYSCFVTDERVALLGRNGTMEILNYTLIKN